MASVATKRLSRSHSDSSSEKDSESEKSELEIVESEEEEADEHVENDLELLPDESINIVQSEKNVSIVDLSNSQNQNFHLKKLKT